MPTIDISDKVKDRLDGIKEEEQVRSYDAAVRELIHAYDDD